MWILVREKEFEIELQKYSEQLEEVAAQLGISFDEVKQAIKNLAKAIGNIVDRVSEVCNSIVERIEKVDLEEMDREWKRNLHKIDFSRPKIQHQVMCRKPKNLVKKIIR